MYASLQLCEHIQIISMVRKHLTGFVTRVYDDMSTLFCQGTVCAEVDSISFVAEGLNGFSLRTFLYEKYHSELETPYSNTAPQVCSQLQSLKSFSTTGVRIHAAENATKHTKQQKHSQCLKAT